jgi:hypothetical protein
MRSVVRNHPIPSPPHIRLAALILQPVLAVIMLLIVDEIIADAILQERHCHWTVYDALNKQLDVNILAPVSRRPRTHSPAFICCSQLPGRHDWLGPISQQAHASPWVSYREEKIRQFHLGLRPCRGAKSTETHYRGTSQRRWPRPPIGVFTPTGINASIGEYLYIELESVLSLRRFAMQASQGNKNLHQTA